MTATVATLSAASAPPVFSLAPQSLDEALRFADMLAKSDLVPKDYQGKPGNCLVAIQWGVEIGLHPLQAMQNIAVINGRPALWGDAMLALCRAHPSFESIEEVETDEGATVTVKRRGQPACVRTFSVEDAKLAGLLGKPGPWQTARRRMMKLRARAFALRDTFADVLRGIPNAEEVADLPRERDMGAVEQVAPEAATRTAQVKALIQQQPEPVTLAAVLGTFQAAATLEALHAAGAEAARLASEADQSAAEKAYRARRAELRRAAAPKAEAGAEPSKAAPKAAAETAPAAGKAEPRSAAELDADALLKTMEARRDVDALDADADLIGQFADQDMRAMLTTAYRGFREALTGQAGA